MTAASAPLFSIVTPVYNPPVDVLKDTLDSVLAQTFSDWEILLVDDCSPDPAVRETLRDYASRDERIRVIERETNGHIVKASNDGIDAARGEFIALLDHDDLLVPEALERNAAVIEQFDDVDYIYSDEDKVGADGEIYDEFRKPAWSPERLRGQNYVCHFSVLRTALVREIGGFREGYDGSQDHDIVLRVTERARRVVHIPEVLYHWRVIPGSAAGDIDAKPYAAIAGRQAVADQCERLGIDAEVVHGPVPGIYMLERRLPADAKVSLVIPTIGTEDMVWGSRRVFVVEAVRSLIEKAGHDNLEIVVVYDTPTPDSVLESLREVAGERLVLVHFTEKFNYSRKMNLGVIHATGEYLALLNDDLEAYSQDWVPRLVGPLLEPDVGMTGAKLFFSNDTLQHGGHAYAKRNFLHPFIFAPRHDLGPFGALTVNREASGVTAAAAAMRRETYFEVGGFTETLPANFNDVDLCNKVRRCGYRIVWVANVEMYHFESRTRERAVHQWEVDIAFGRWGKPQTDAYLPVF